MWAQVPGMDLVVNEDGTSVRWLGPAIPVVPLGDQQVVYLQGGPRPVDALVAEAFETPPAASPPAVPVAELAEADVKMVDGSTRKVKVLDDPPDDKRKPGAKKK